MIYRLCQLCRSRNGSVTIEFSVLFILFLASIFFMMEITRLIYLSAKIDLAISEAAKTAKNTPDSNNNYQEIFQNALRANDSLFDFSNGKKNTTTITVDFSSTVEDFIAGKSEKNGNNKPLARYGLRYKYQPAFFPLSKDWANILLNREVIFVQEYER